jgi:hypothetical protein
MYITLSLVTYYVGVIMVASTQENTDDCERELPCTQTNTHDCEKEKKISSHPFNSNSRFSKWRINSFNIYPNFKGMVTPSYCGKPLFILVEFPVCKGKISF